MPALAHLGVGFFAKYVNPKVPLWVLLLASILLDLLTFIFSDALWKTHGMIMTVMWAFLASIIYFVSSKLILRHKFSNKDGFRNCLTIFLVVFSHWVLDLIGWPMSCMPGNEELVGTPFFFSDQFYIGLGVYRTWFGALTMEIGFLVGGVLFAGRYYVPKWKSQKKEKLPVEPEKGEYNNP